MKHTETNTHSDRLWDCIEIKFEYGYFGVYPPMRISCYCDGDLTFEAEGSIGGIPIEDPVCDRSHSVGRKSLGKLDELVDEIREMDCLEGARVMDGPSFECSVRLANGTLIGFHYVSMLLSEKFQDMETSLRKILREEFFLKKHKNAFGF